MEEMETVASTISECKYEVQVEYQMEESETVASTFSECKDEVAVRVILFAVISMTCI